MKKLLFIIFFLFQIVSQSWAADTDIYSVSTIDIKPNVLIIFDNSGSMSTQDVPGETYDPNSDYSYTGGRPRNNVYLRKNNNYNTLYFTDITDAKWKCDPAKASLTTLGYWTGEIQLNSTTGIVTCDGTISRTLRLGNFQNFDAQDLGDSKTRMEVAKKVIAQLIYDNHEKVRFGLMKFNPLTPSSYYGSSSDKQYESGFIIAGCGASKTDLIGSFDPATTVFTDDNQSANFGAIGGMYSDTYTPLAETMAEAGRYFAGTDSWFNGPPTGTGYPYGKFSSSCATSASNCTNYSTVNPIQYRCQKNYIIFMTDGDPTLDGNSKLRNNNYLNGIKIPSAGKDGAANYLDDIAYFLAHNDMQKIGSNPTTDELLRKGHAGDFENQTVTTYTIGFKQAAILLQNAATNGGGVYYTADNASTLNEALNNIITAIYDDNEGFSAAAVPVSRANKAYAGNFVYYGLFQPVTSGNWVGNLKKYGITDLGVITDQNGNSAASNGSILSNAQSYWSPTIDGPSVVGGGAGEKLVTDLENGVSRKIYTYTGTNSLLTDTTNLFVSSNTTILEQFNSQLTADTISAIRHDSDNKWPLGSLLHSQPVVVHYDDDIDGNDDHSIIFAGANDGMLHCFDDNDGSEKWGYIPQDLLAEINTLPNASALQYYVDGSPELYTYDHDNDPLTQNKKMLIFGERRGGTHYTALDISNYNAPLMKYVIAPDILGEGTKVLGQSWGKPAAITIGYTHDSTYSTKDVFLLPGGYDTNQDSTTPSATDDEGRAIFAVDAQTGALQTNLNFNADTFSYMTHSVVAVAPFENPKSRTTTRIYAGDMNGNLFAFRDDIFHRNRDQSLKADFAGLYDGQEDGNWEQKLKLFSSPGQKIFYPPNILNVYFPVQFTYPALEVGESEDVVKTETRVGDYVFYGTGDREHPEDLSVLNEFYAIKNNWSWDGSTAPSIKKAYIDTDDGTIKDTTNNQTLVARDSDGHLIITANSQPFIIDVTADLYQAVTTDEETERRYQQFSTEAINHPSNKGWYIRFAKEDGSLEGEKVVSTPIIYGGVIYFTTYVPDTGTDSTDDPCANPGAKGTGYLYAIGVRYGEAVMDWDTPTTNSKLNRRDRRLKLTGLGIPPEPVLVIHEGKPTIVTGFETIEPHFSQSLEQFFWRQLYN